jgi:hypothetical protein
VPRLCEPCGPGPRPGGPGTDVRVGECVGPQPGRPASAPFTGLPRAAGTGTGCKLFIFEHNSDNTDHNGVWQFLTVTGTLTNRFNNNFGGWQQDPFHFDNSDPHSQKLLWGN